MTEIELSMEFHCVLSYSNLHEESPLVEFRLASFHMKLFSSEIAINNHLYSFDHNKRDSLLLISLEAVDNTYKRSSEHLTVSVTLAWLNNCGNEDGGSCLAQRRGLDPVRYSSFGEMPSNISVNDDIDMVYVSCFGEDFDAPPGHHFKLSDSTVTIATFVLDGKPYNISCDAYSFVMCISAYTLS
ncbi:hypothetical protein HID58_013700 [Brassica napus]|uniref:Uncharacterized protein n=1 Tax=Brassica napus TaxID=3708 RepID=A0ABQ8E4N1_BRANA|nr:hypothetical protein HID58_013700 [Brassica napus]